MLVTYTHVYIVVIVQKNGADQDQTKLQTLTQMGFERNIAKYALTESANDIQAAIQFLFAMQSSQKTPNTLAQSNTTPADLALTNRTSPNKCYCGKPLIPVGIADREVNWMCHSCWTLQNTILCFACEDATKCNNKMGDPRYLLCAECAMAPAYNDVGLRQNLLLSKLSASVLKISSE